MSRNANVRFREEDDGDAAHDILHAIKASEQRLLDELWRLRSQLDVLGSADFVRTTADIASSNKEYVDGAYRSCSMGVAFSIGENGTGSPTHAPRFPTVAYDVVGEESTPRRTTGTGNSPKRSSAWPGTVTLRREWLDFWAKEDRVAEARESLLEIASCAELGIKDAVSGFLESRGHTRRFKRVLQPEAPQRLAFELLSIVVLVLDMIYTPFALTWHQSVSEPTAVKITICSAIFWMIDMALSFNTGYQTAEGFVEMRTRKIAIRYLRTWFVVDGTCVLGDVIYLFSVIFLNDRSGVQNVSRVLRFLKLTRFLHVLGMFRMLKVMNRLNKKMEARFSEGWVMMVRIFQMTACLGWLTHLAACGWFAVGSGGDTGELDNSWLETKVGLNKDSVIKDLSTYYQYVTSYHWALAHLTLGAIDINPINIGERVFTIVCNLLGVLLGGTLIAILSNTLIELKEYNQDRACKLRTLLEFLKQHKVDIGVRMQVIRQVEERLDERGQMWVERDVQALRHLSQGLLRELRCCLFSTHVLTNRMLSAWSRFDSPCLQSMCERGTEFKVLRAEDELFCSGKEATLAYYLLGGGCLHYTLDPNRFTMKQDSTAVVNKGTWLCEAAWWCEWEHVGSATSVKHQCTLLSITAKALHKAAKADPVICLLTAEYAKLFHERVASSVPGHYPTDLQDDSADFNDLISAMPKEVRVGLGVATLKRAYRKSLVTSSRIQASIVQLMEEVRNDRSVVLHDTEERLQRHVGLSILRIEKGDKVLVQLADYDCESDVWVAFGKLPGTKQQLGELPSQTIQRFVEQRLVACSGLSDWSCYNTSQETGASERFGVRTVYTKHSFNIWCDSELEAKLCEDSHLLSNLTNKTEEDARPSRFSSLFNTSGEQLVTSRMLGMGETYSVPRPTVKAAELHKELAQVTEVYLLHGSESIGIFTWMHEHALDGIAQHPDYFSLWLRRNNRYFPSAYTHDRLDKSHHLAAKSSDKLTADAEVEGQQGMELWIVPHEELSY